MNKTEIESLIHDYVARNLSVEVDVNREMDWMSGSCDSKRVTVRIYLDGKEITGSSSSI